MISRALNIVLIIAMLALFGVGWWFWMSFA
jgi:hypothetical protein